MSARWEWLPSPEPLWRQRVSWALRALGVRWRLPAWSRGCWVQVVEVETTMTMVCGSPRVGGFIQHGS